MPKLLVRLALVGLSLSLPTAQALADPLSKIGLPAAVSYPEGVAYDRASGTLYAGSAGDGGLYRIDAASGAARPIAPPGKIAPPGARFPAMLGMKLDGEGRLWIAGGWTGLVSVVTPDDGRIVLQAKVPTTPASLLNDVAIVDGAAYVTDTFTPILWRMRGQGGLEPWLDLKSSPIVYADGPNLNGIAADTAGQALIVVQMNKGALYRIDLKTKAVTRIDVGGADLTGADGLVLIGRSLLVVRQWAGEVVTLALDEKGEHGAVVSRFSHPDLAYPATATVVGDDLVLVNAQFDKHDAGDATRPFTLARIPLVSLAIKP